MAAAKKSTTRAKKPAATKSAAPRASTKKFLRNLTGYEVGIRLERQERPKKRHDIKPRGQRGDLVLLQKDDLSDPAVTENVALGVVEVITEAEARKVIEQQNTNRQARIHPALGLLTNELGEKIDTVVVEEDEADRGLVVARLEEGQLPSQGKGVDWDRVAMENAAEAKDAPLRNTTVDPRNVSAPGVVDAGEQADFLARQKSAQTPAALGLSVSIEPTRKG